MSETCLVIDVWEGQLNIDEKVMRENGVAGVGIRINDMNGGHHMDTSFARQWVEAEGMVRFPYFVYNPWVSGRENYSWLAANMPYGAKSVAIDVEVVMAGYPATTYAGELNIFLELAKTKWKTIIYTAQWFLPYLSKWPKMDYWWAQYPDQERYFGNVKTWDDVRRKLMDPVLARPWNEKYCPGTVKMWQFSGDYLRLPGTSRDIDVNVFYGSAAELAAYFGDGQDADAGDVGDLSLEEKVEILWKNYQARN